MSLNKYNGKLIKITDNSGNVLMGEADTFLSGYGLHEFNREEESIKLGDYQIFESDIVKIEELPHFVEAGRNAAVDYDLDQVIDRHGTDCFKFDSAKMQGMPEDNLSLWVADMDFPVSENIKNALRDAVDKGIFGYTFAGDDYYEAVMGWFKSNFGWETKKEWIVMTPGVVFAVANAVRAFTEPGDKVLIQKPVYYPFEDVILKNNRIAVDNPLKEIRESHDLYESSGTADGSHTSESGTSYNLHSDSVRSAENELSNNSPEKDDTDEPVRYEMDFADLEEKLKDPALKLMILCSPHNPVGRVWTQDELIRVEELCLKYGVILVSDEIHADFVWPGNTHRMLASIDPRYTENTIICTAPSKTFNLAGLQLSNIFIANQKLRAKYKKLLAQEAVGNPNQLAIAACKAAYQGGKEWLDQVRRYIYDNICFTEQYLKQNIPELKMTRTEGTYLVWVDFRAFGLSNEELTDLIVNKAGLWLDEGTMFGRNGAGFERINVACSRKYLKLALDRLKVSCSKIRG